MKKILIAFAHGISHTIFGKFLYKIGIILVSLFSQEVLRDSSNTVIEIIKKSKPMDK